MKNKIEIIENDIDWQMDTTLTNISAKSLFSLCCLVHELRNKLITKLADLDKKISKKEVLVAVMKASKKMTE